MVRFSKAALLLGNVALSSSALAQGGLDNLASLPVINGHTTPGEFRALASNPALKTCAEPQCAALRSLAFSYSELRRYYTPNTMGRTADNPPDTTRPRLAIQSSPSDTPIEHDAISRDLVIIARDVPDWSSELLTIEIATLADPSGQIARRVVASIPKTPALAGIVKIARERCQASGETACDAIAVSD